MNFVKNVLRLRGVRRELQFGFIFSMAAVLLCVTGCGEPIMPTASQLSEFEKAGPLTPELDNSRLFGAKIHTGHYQVVAGDLLSLQMPLILQDIYSELSNSFDKIEPYLCRIGDDGNITLPIIGDVAVTGKKLVEIESLLVDKYYPAYVVRRPTIVCKMVDYQTENVSIAGGVEEPGVYSLQSDEMSLVSLLMKAGGIVEEGASLITIERPEHAGEQKLTANNADINSAYVFHTPQAKKKPSTPPFGGKKRPAAKKYLTVTVQNKVIYSAKTDIADKKDRADMDKPQQTITSAKNDDDSGPIVLPVKGLNIPFADVALHDGDVVEVKKLDPEVFTVIGHVNKSGAYPYPPDTTYNLMQAISFAEGINYTAAPRHVTIYRQAADGEVVSVSFGIDQKSFASAYKVMIKPGDVISADSTLRTKTNLLISQFLRVNVGVYIRPLDDI